MSVSMVHSSDGTGQFQVPIHIIIPTIFPFTDLPRGKSATSGNVRYGSEADLSCYVIIEGILSDLSLF